MFTPLRDINMPAIEIVKRPRKRGRPLTYEEKWMVQHVFEKFQHNKKEKSTVIVEDPYSMTSEYTGVSRTTVSNIVKSVKDTGTVPKLTFPGNRCQQPTISVSVEEIIRDFIFDKHRMGAICNANHIVHLLKREFNLEVHERTVRRHLQRMGFCWSRTKHKPRSLRESNKVHQQRHDYLYEIKKNRSLSVENCPFAYFISLPDLL
jgi:transposase